MDVNKIRSFCRVFRIIVGLSLITYGVYTIVNETPNYWFFLGLIPLMAGVFNFCPLCIITKRCDLEDRPEDSE